MMVNGTIIMLDLDRFKEFTRARGLDEYRPNDITGLLSAEVERLARKWQGIVVYGLDWKRGTEEAVLEIPLVGPEELENDLVAVARSICEAGASITIVAVEGPITGRPARNRREAYEGYRRRVKRLLESVKSKRPGQVYINGQIVYACLNK